VKLVSDGLRCLTWQWLPRRTLSILLKGPASLLVIEHRRTSMDYTSLAFSECQLGVLVKIRVLACIDLANCVTTLGDNHKPHFAVFVDDHAGDFGVRSFASSGCFVSIEFYIVSSADL